MNKFVNKKRIASMIIIFLMGCLFLSLSPSTAQAKSDYGISQAFEFANIADTEKYNGADDTTYYADAKAQCGKEPGPIIKIIAYEVAKYETYATAAIIKAGDLVTDTILLKGFSSSLNQAFTNARSTIKSNVLPPLQSIGFCLVIVFFLIKLLEHIISGQMTLESFVKMFTKLAVGLFAVQYSVELFDLLFNLGEGLAILVNNAFNQSAQIQSSYNLKANANALAASWTKAGGISWLPGTLFSGVFAVVMFLIAIVLLIIAFVISFTRVFEVLIRGTFLPLGLAFLAENGWNGGGGRYIKKYLACCSQCMVLVLEGKVLSFLLSNVFQAGLAPVSTGSFLAESGLSILPAFIIACALAISGFGVMFKSQGVVNDIFGV